MCFPVIENSYVAGGNYVSYTDFDIRVALSTKPLLIKEERDLSIKVNQEIPEDPNQHAPRS